MYSGQQSSHCRNCRLPCFVLRPRSFHFRPPLAAPPFARACSTFPCRLLLPGAHSLPLLEPKILLPTLTVTTPAVSVAPPAANPPATTMMMTVARRATGSGGVPGAQPRLGSACVGWFAACGVVRYALPMRSWLEPRCECICGICQCATSAHLPIVRSRTLPPLGATRASSWKSRLLSLFL